MCQHIICIGENDTKWIQSYFTQGDPSEQSDAYLCI